MLGAAASVLSSPLISLYANSSDIWGASKGYPTGRDPRWNTTSELRVGNYSGGYESFIRHQIFWISTPLLGSSFGEMVNCFWSSIGLIESRHIE